MHRFLLLVTALCIAPDRARADEFFLKPKERVLFLGDSNTYAGLFIGYIDGYLLTRFPDQRFELINLGLPSETVSGLSEADHPYPRPDVHERADRALAKTRPDVVVICYGMNDGIYSPFSDERFARFRQGMQQLIERVHKAGARVVLMSPAPFDPLPLQGRTLAGTAPKFSWMKPYQDYDNVLARYSAWLVGLRHKGFLVVDAHTIIRGHLAEKRRSDPKYFVSGDGIHPNATGHRLIAEALLKAWGAPVDVEVAAVDGRTGKVSRGKLRDVKRTDDTLEFSWRTRIPMPALGSGLNRHRLTVTGLPDKTYALFEGDKSIGKVTAQACAEGIDLTRFPELSTNRRAAEVAKLAVERQQLLGLAWLSHVGHKRPDTPGGLPLAEAQRRGALLASKMRILAQPTPVSLRFVGLGSSK